MSVASLFVFFILMISTITDLHSRRILNIITIPAILLALTYHSAFFGLGGFLFSGKGLLVGLGILFIPFLMRGIGAGDVKLLAAVGAWQGSAFVIYTGIYAGIFGGIIALFLLLKQRQLRYTVERMISSLYFLKSAKGSLELSSSNKHQNQSVAIPYAVPITLGAITTFIMERF